MHNLQLADFDYSATKQKAIEDARKAQLSIVRECSESGKEPPPYLLAELIGKGSFGRVYKATGTRIKPGQLVAVKIISIEEGDTLSPGAADTFNDILKEVNTLKLLTSSGARNINAVVDTLLVGQSVWIVTEYCAGGSVASLMRPTGGLPEKWIIPILREVAEAIYWVHRQGIIHRDIKCANVLVTELGGVQLCDFGVAGIMETKFDKRSTVTGTLQWMAPELFDSAVSYGIEVDIWAFGSMAYEVASGLPPNATTTIDLPQFGSYLKQYCPRLEGDQYSGDLKSLVAYCLVEDPKQRPSIERVQEHPYIFNTDDEYPTTSLSKLVSAYKVWENQGGSRRSLFSAGGAQGSLDDSSPDLNDDEWVFTDDDSPDQFAFEPAEAQAVFDAYDLNPEAPPQPVATPKAGRRRRPPQNMRAYKAPLEKVFDPNTMTNYGESARAFYGKAASPPPADLPLRDDSNQSTVRESLIDLDASFGDLETIKPGLAVRPISDAPVDFDKRKTQDWTFPSMAMAPPDSDGPDPQPYQSRNNSSLGGNLNFSLPTTQVFHPAEDAFGNGYHTELAAPSALPNRESTLSLIDLDAGLVGMADDMDSATSESYPFSGGSTLVALPNNRESTLSLIDLDAGLMGMDEIPRPSTAEPYSLPNYDAAPMNQSNRTSNLSLIDLDASLRLSVPDLPWSFSAASAAAAALPHSRMMSTSSNADSYPMSNHTDSYSMSTNADSYSLSTSSSTDSTLVPNSNHRASNMSLIDLDASLVDSMLGGTDFTRPSTAGSQTTSPGSLTGSTPFDLEFQARSLPAINTSYPTAYREPSMYITDETDLTLSVETLERLRNATPSPSPPRIDGGDDYNDDERTNTARRGRGRAGLRGSSYHPDGIPGFPDGGNTTTHPTQAGSAVPPLPPLPTPPSANVLQGMGSREELKSELQSMIASLNEHLQYTADYLRTVPPAPTWKQLPRGEEVLTHRYIPSFDSQVL
ncbi:hypothetical protein B0H63DRAFT_488866 [Podospora didyma]|uniref:non-specific serine/threonine protein kinase n=1 Tax=Podospora didyma TaxID=330526 RepID=A0AAE0K371_9PEZI|nr:hypothetical protein B0H63DRAFT_488866 [Podospora didyma]